MVVGDELGVVQIIGVAVIALYPRSVEAAVVVEAGTTRRADQRDFAWYAVTNLCFQEGKSDGRHRSEREGGICSKIEAFRDAIVIRDSNVKEKKKEKMKHK